MKPGSQNKNAASKPSKNPADARVKEEVKRLTAYSVPHIDCPVKLDGNESPFTLPPELSAEVLGQIGNIEFNRYPDPEAKSLRGLISDISSFPEAGIVLGNGSDELIGMLITAFTGGTGCILIPAPTFSMYGLSGLALGARVLEAGLDDKFDLDMERMAVIIEKEDPDIIFLASPNNPTGNVYSTARIREIIELSKGIVVVDEAYSDFSGVTFLPLVEERENLVVMRTLSKIGFAGLRLGILYASQSIAHEINKVRYPYNINSMSQAAAEIVLRNRGFIGESVRLITSERVRVFKELSGIKGIEAFPSDANFILFRVKDADSVFQGLIDRGVLIRNFNRPGRLENCMRVTIGTQTENDAFLAALRGVLAS